MLRKKAKTVLTLVLLSCLLSLGSIFAAYAADAENADNRTQQNVIIENGKITIEEIPQTSTKNGELVVSDEEVPLGKLGTPIPRTTRIAVNVFASAILLTGCVCVIIAYKKIQNPFV